MKNYLIGIDAGNTSSKVVIFDEFGTIMSEASTPSMRFEQRGPGFEEFDMDNLWKDITVCIRTAIDKSGVDAKDIKGIGVTSFGNGVAFVGKNGETIAPGCFSHDHRADDIIAMYKEQGVYDKINDIVKGTLFAGEPGPILRWYKEHEREVYDKIGGAMMFKDYIMYKLTGVLATDLNCWGGSFMFDLETMDYSEELFKLYGIEEMMDAMPELHEATDIVGRVKADVSEITGLAEGTPVCAGMMDILACLVGSGAIDDGVYTAVAGSWSINETHSHKILPGLSSNMPYLYKGQYLNCSYTGASGSNYEWFTKILGDRAKIEAKKRGISFYQVLDEMIQCVDPASTDVIFGPFVAQPSLHPNTKAHFINIDLNTTYEEMCHAVAEGCAFIHKHHIDILQNAGLPLEVVRLTGGTARSKVWNQIFANILKVPIVGVDCEETGALGSAIAAGIGAGVYRDYEDAFDKAVKILPPIYPDESMYPIYDKKYAEWVRLNSILMEYWEKK
ncbi:MAG: carbohydrate kinase [Eubacterium sp.]|nr:carbohydrate kinase [Eubacterium sp.]